MGKLVHDNDPNRSGLTSVYIWVCFVENRAKIAGWLRQWQIRSKLSPHDRLFVHLNSGMFVVSGSLCMLIPWFHSQLYRYTLSPTLFALSSHCHRSSFPSS